MVWLYRAKRAQHSLERIPRIPKQPPSSTEETRIPVTVIIPAKNEEKNIGECVRRFLSQTHPCVQILVANDRSSDQTEPILRSMSLPCLPLAASPTEGTKSGYVNCPPTLDGWTGKNSAIHAALPYATGDWLLFTDADTRHESESITSALAYCRSHDLEYLTLSPRCITASWIEHALQPLAMAFLGLWFPLEEVNNPRSEKIFGNGQYLFIRRTLYLALGGHKRVAGEFLEDYAFTALVKKNRRPFRVAIGNALFGTRMYDSYESFWRGWRRIYLHAFRQDAKTLGVKALEVLFFSVFPFLAFFFLLRLALVFPLFYGFSLGLAFAVLIFMGIVGWKAYGMIGAKKRYVFLHPLAAIPLFCILIDAAWMAASGKKTVWR